MRTGINLTATFATSVESNTTIGIESRSIARRRSGRSGRSGAFQEFAHVCQMSDRTTLVARLVRASRTRMSEDLARLAVAMLAVAQVDIIFSLAG